MEVQHPIQRPQNQSALHAHKLHYFNLIGSLQRDNYATVTQLISQLIFESFPHLKLQEVVIDGIVWALNEMIIRRVGTASGGVRALLVDLF